MTLLDANILLYAYDSEARQHRRAAAWIQELFRGTEMIGIPWPTIWAFLRVRTNIRLVRNPRPAEESFAIVRGWLSLPGVKAIAPGPRHAELLAELVAQANALGPLLSDAVLAALALEHGATLASADNDFSRFKTLRWTNPLDP